MEKEKEFGRNENFPSRGRGHAFPDTPKEYERHDHEWEQIAVRMKEKWVQVRFRIRIIYLFVCDGRSTNVDR